MRILYDGDMYCSQVAGGITRYFNELIGRLPNTCEPVLTLVDQRAKALPRHPRLRVLRARVPLVRPWNLCRAVERRLMYAASCMARCDVLHSTYYTLLAGERLLRRYPCVVTVYDMIHELFASEIDPEGYWAATKRRVILAADAVICISEHTRNDLLERIPLSPDRVFVVPLASSLKAPTAVSRVDACARPYLLYVGARSTYKNFGRLAQAFARVAEVKPDLMLRVVGGPFTAAEQAMLDGLGITERVVLQGIVSDDELSALYGGSLALVYPSLYEGFGIPPLEAMGCGAAVIASNTSSIPEVVGDAAVLVNPLSVDEIADAIRLLHDNPTERERLVHAGLARAAMFSWEKTAILTAKVYAAVARS